VEDNYWQTLRDLDLFSDVTPINIESEKKLFLNAFYKGKSYNPIFIYNNKRSYLDLLKLQEAFKFTPTDACINAFYHDHLLEEIKWLSTFAQRNHSDFSSMLSSLYPAPLESDIDFAQKVVASELVLRNNISLKTKTVSSTVAKTIFESIFESLGFKDWTVILRPISAKAMVSSLKKQLILRSDYEYSEYEIERLKVHEIYTHVQRYENGRKQIYSLFKYGFPKYLETEEGLAIYNEEKNDVLSGKDFKKYALRFLACYWANIGSFEFVFQKLLDFTTEVEAWEIVVRVKRGLVDTSENGGFFKDQIYLRGYNRVKELNEDQICKLWIGKIGIEHLDLVDTCFS
jgi:hypothetical protein